MRIPALACALICFFAVSELTKAQELKGLRRVQIEVTPLNKADKEMDLTVESLWDQTLVALKRDIPKLKIEDAATSLVSVRVTSISTGGIEVASSVEVVLSRPVEIIADDGIKSYTLAVVWEKSSLLVGPFSNMASRIHEEISEKLTAFAAKYYKDNP